MRFMGQKTFFPARITTGAEVIFSQNRAKNIISVGTSKGFTLIEVLTVVILIGILSALAYSSLMDLIFTNRAKETAQTMRTFVERALAESKRLQVPVTISVSENQIRYAVVGRPDTVTQPFTNGFSANVYAEPGSATKIQEVTPFAGETVTSKLRIGLSGIDTTGYFAACGARGYCGAAVKTQTNNNFQAWIKKGNSAEWEAL